MPVRIHFNMASCPILSISPVLMQPCEWGMCCTGGGEQSQTPSKGKRVFVFLTTGLFCGCLSGGKLDRIDLFDHIQDNAPQHKRFHNMANYEANLESSLTYLQYHYYSHRNLSYFKEKGWHYCSTKAFCVQCLHPSWNHLCQANTSLIIQKALML